MTRWLCGLLTLFAAAPALAGDPPSFLATRYGPLRIFPADNAWNRDISRLAVHPRSADYIGSIGADETVHADFGTVWQGAPIGIPYVVVGPDQPKVAVRFRYDSESDAGPYPIPDDVPIEGGPDADGDRHVLIVSPKEKRLYELYKVTRDEQGWRADSGAIWDLTSNTPRKLGWTSADAAGLPIFPGLARHDEAAVRGVIPHALRMTVKRSQKAFIAPATHHAGSSDDPKLPPMGLRLRLKRSVDPRKFPKPARAVVVALQRYGAIVADNGSNWYLSGAPHPKWNDGALRSLRRIKGSDFEVVDTGEPVKPED